MSITNLALLLVRKKDYKKLKGNPSLYILKISHARLPGIREYEIRGIFRAAPYPLLKAGKG